MRGCLQDGLNPCSVTRQINSVTLQDAIHQDAHHESRTGIDHACRFIRDDNGRPRQRILANLHGEPGTLEALVKLAFQREDRQRFRDEQWANLSAHDET